ncbi:MAG: phosphatase PAP2 family protein [Bacteroidetes bacterium]|nr:phosphatase PAP2 family protein [Bacteroidota bacterium]
MIFCTGSTGLSQNVDIDFLRSISHNRNKNLDNSFTFITNSMLPVGIATPVVVFSFGTFKKNRAVQEQAVQFGGALALSALVTTGIKYTVNRPRPFETYPDIENVTGAGSPSFPSGHTSSAFTVATSLALNYPKWYVIAPAYLWAGAVGYSRMHLGVHYPSDVLAGAIIGAGSSLVAWRISKLIFKKVECAECPKF